MARFGASYDWELRVQHAADPLVNLHFLQPDHPEYTQYRTLVTLFAMEQKVLGMCQAHPNGTEPLTVEIREPPGLPMGHCIGGTGYQ